MNFEKCFGENIKKFRTAKKLSQEKLAEMLEISTNTVSKIERGKRFVTAETLIHIIKALDIMPHELFVFKNKESAKEIHNKILNFLKTDEIKNDLNFLLLLYELIKEHLKNNNK